MGIRRALIANELASTSTVQVTCQSEAAVTCGQGKRNWKSNKFMIAQTEFARRLTSKNDENVGTTVDNVIGGNHVDTRFNFSAETFWNIHLNNSLPLFSFLFTIRQLRYT